MARRGERQGNLVHSRHGRLSRLSLGGMTLGDVSVALLSTAKFAPAANGKQVAGVIGTGLLSRFVATIDYPKGMLHLQGGARIGGIVSHGFLRPYAVTFDFKNMVIEVRDEKS